MDMGGGPRFRRLQVTRLRRGAPATSSTRTAAQTIFTDASENRERSSGLDHLDLRTQIVETCRRMSATGLVAGTEGNVSVRTPEGDILITPSGLDYAVMEPRSEEHTSELQSRQ